MKKKIISALMVGVLCVSVFAFAGCSSSGSGSSGDTIKIGALGPYTGDTAMYGVAAKNGIDPLLQCRNKGRLRTGRSRL